MNRPAETLQLPQEEQGRLLARVYAFILSDQFIGTKQEPGKKSDEPSTMKRKERTTGDTTVLDVETADSQEPKE